MAEISLRDEDIHMWERSLSRVININMGFLFEEPANPNKLRVPHLTYTEKKKGITCNETESSKRVTDHSRGINALH